MLRSLATFLGKRTNQSSQPSEVDIRYFIERWLQDRLQTQHLSCEGVGGGEVWVRVSSPVLAQEVYVLEYDLQEAVRQEFSHWRWRDMTVIQRL